MDDLRFQRYIKRQDNGCWLWTGGTSGKGYGKCAHEGRTLGAHVMSHMLYNGEVPQGLVVRHTCNVKLCVNPAHLILGTYKDNLEDARISNGSVGRTPDVPQEIVLQIFALRKRFQSTAVIAERLGLPVDYVTGVISGNFRKDLKLFFEQQFGELPKFHAGIKYTDEERAEMVRLYTSGEMTAQQIADHFGTNYKYVWKLAQKYKPLQRRGDN